MLTSTHPLAIYLELTQSFLVSELLGHIARAVYCTKLLPSECLLICYLNLNISAILNILHDNTFGNYHIIYLNDCNVVIKINESLC